MTTFNTELAINVLAEISLAGQNQYDNLYQDDGHNPKGLWNQGHWAYIDKTPEGAVNDQGDVIVDEKTGLPMGVDSCGTAYCFAGWATHLSGVKLEWDATSFGTLKASATQGGEYVSAKAADLLGIPNYFDVEKSWRDETGQVQEGFYEDRLWDHGNGLPALFDAENQYRDLIWHISAWSGLEEEVIDSMVERAVKVLVKEEAAAKKVAVPTPAYSL